MTRDRKQGLRAKAIIELLFAITQLISAIIIAMLVIIFFQAPRKIFLIICACVFLLWLTRFLNPIYANFGLWKSIKQMYFGEASIYTQKQFDQDHKDKNKDD